MIFHYTVQLMDCNFRENLRNELNYQDITIKELSVRTGIPISSLDCYLGARETVPSVDTAVKIAQALQVSVEYLVIGENADAETILNKPSQEAQDIIRWIKGLNTDQCRAIQKLIKTFR